MSCKETISLPLDVAFRQFQTFDQAAIDGAVLLENLVAPHQCSCPGDDKGVWIKVQKLVFSPNRSL
jgi:hypothetical protein